MRMVEAGKHATEEGGELVDNKCPKCGEAFAIVKDYDGVGGAYVVYTHKRQDKNGHMTEICRRCTVNRDMPIEKIAQPSTLEDGLGDPR